MSKYNLKRQPRQLPNGDIEIPLTQGLFSIVSIESSQLTEIKWFTIQATKDKSRPYAARHLDVQGKDTFALLHRQVMELYLNRALHDDEDVDHINGDTLDNRISNLRVCTRSQNLFNSKLNNRNSSGFKGVSYNKKCKKWTAYITVNYKTVYLGLFTTPEEAYKARCEKQKELHRDFARFK